MNTTQKESAKTKPHAADMKSASEGLDNTGKKETGVKLTNSRPKFHLKMRPELFGFTGHKQKWDKENFPPNPTVSCRSLKPSVVKDLERRGHSEHPVRSTDRTNPITLEADTVARSWQERCGNANGHKLEVREAIGRTNHIALEAVTIARSWQNRRGNADDGHKVEVCEATGRTSPIALEAAAVTRSMHGLCSDELCLEAGRLAIGRTNPIALEAAAIARSIQDCRRDAAGHNLTLREAIGRANCQSRCLGSCSCRWKHAGLSAHKEHPAHSTGFANDVLGTKPIVFEAAVIAQIMKEFQEHPKGTGIKAK